MTIAHVRRTALAAGFALLGFSTMSAQSPVTAEAAADYETFAGQLERLTDGPGRVAAISTLILSRDRATITLEGGRLFLLRAVGSLPAAVLYEGAGRIQLAPPDEAERRRLARYHKTEELDARFEDLVLIFADGTAEEFAGLSWSDAEVPGSLERRWREAIDFVSDWDQKTLDPDLAAPLLNGVRDGFFHAHMAGGRLGDPIAFRVNPNEVEGVQLLSRARGTGFTRYMESVAQFRPEGDGAPAAGDRRGGVEVRHYVLDAKLDRTGTGDVSFTADAALDLSATSAAGPWIAFALYEKLIVDSARWSDGSPATFYKNRDGDVVWLKADRRLVAGDERSVRLWYHGDLVDRFGDWFFIRSSASWYPRALDGRSMATFDITFHTPSNYRIASVGRLADSTVAGQTLTTRWVADRPMRNAGFNLGLFEDYRVEEDGAPPVTVLWSERGHKELARAAIAYGVPDALPSASGKKDVGSDISQSLKFFSHVFGPPPVERFYATEIPAGHGEAFPGIVHLSWSTFVGTDKQGTDEWFRAHEVAHQWWGIGVDFTTYRDQWLSEGFASFAGLWYLQTVRKDNKRYFNLLERWRGDIVRRSEEGGPISLGYRTATADTRSDYQTLVYHKGAWVLHMLRIMMLDLRTMNEDRFTSTMQEFYHLHRGGRASTDDFRRVAEKHIRTDLGWFFDQWVHGTAVPTYRASYETEPLAGGEVKMTVRVIQENVPDDFQAYVPVTVELEGDRVLRTRVKVVGRETTAVLPTLPGQPKKFRFNDLDGVLAVVRD